MSNAKGKLEKDSNWKIDIVKVERTADRKVNHYQKKRMIQDTDTECCAVWIRDMDIGQ